MKFRQKLNEIFVKTEILQETLFLHDRESNWKTRKSTMVQYSREFMKFYPGVVEIWLQTDGRKDRRMKLPLYARPSGSNKTY